MSEEADPTSSAKTRGLTFLVEAGCLSIDAMTRATGLHDLDGTGGSFGLGTERTVEVVERKVSQCAVHGSTPTVLFLGTLHQTAALHSMGERVARNLLTGNPQIAFKIAFRDGEQVGSSGPHSATQLHGAAFVSADGRPGSPIGPRNRHVAAVLVGSASMFWDRDPLAPPPIVGALHPDPTAPFDPLRGLPGMRFYRLNESWRNGRLEAQDVRRTAVAAENRPELGSPAASEASEQTP